MRIEIPKDYSLAFSRDVIAKRVAELSVDINAWIVTAAKAAQNEVLAVCVLRGGAFFFADLLRNFTSSVEPTFCRAHSYGQADNSVLKQMSVEVADLHVLGRPVLLVDDICETGRTLGRLEQYCREQGATEVRTAVLIERIAVKKAFSPAWAAFPYQGDEWFVGYGMDDRNHFANLADVYHVKKSKGA